METMTAQPPVPRVNKRTPHELHWRAEPPEWGGDIDVAYEFYYRHLAEQIFCHHCGAIPCPVDHEEERVNRLRDLEFVRDLSQVKKELEVKCEKLVEDMELIKLRNEQWQEERRALYGQVRDLERMKRIWEGDRVVMEAEIKRLQGINATQQLQIAQWKKDQLKIKALTETVTELESERDTLQADLAKYKRMLLNQTTELQNVKKQNKQFAAELEEATSTIRILKVQLDEANEERKDIKAVIARKDAELNEIKNQMRDIISELEEKTKVFQEKEVKNLTLVGELKQRIGMLMDKIKDGEKLRQDLVKQMNDYLAEIERLRARLRSDKRFQQYVTIKREVSGLREQNVTLLQQVHIEQEQQLPVITSRGDVTTLGSRASSGHVTPKRRRAKSAVTRSVRSPTNRSQLGAALD